MQKASNYNVLLGQDWIHANSCISSTLHQLLIFWERDGVRVVKTDERPFKHDTNATKALYYKNTSLIQLLGADKMRNPTMATPILSVEVIRELHRPIIPHIYWSIIPVMNIQIMSAESVKDQHRPMTYGVNKTIVRQSSDYAKNRRMTYGSIMLKLTQYMKESAPLEEASACLADYEENKHEESIRTRGLRATSPKLEDTLAEVPDPLLEVNLGIEK